LLNIGIGIPYKPDDLSVDLNIFSERLRLLYSEIIQNSGLDLGDLKIVFECGRCITGPAGIIVTRIINHKDTYKKFIGKKMEGYLLNK